MPDFTVTIFYYFRNILNFIYIFQLNTHNLQRAS